MKFTPGPVLGIAAGGLLMGACSTSPPAASPPPSTPTTGIASARFSAESDCQAYVKANPEAKISIRADYVMVAGLGSSETMYTAAQVAQKMPTSGELMVSGIMDDTHSMDMGSGTTMKHVEVHVCSRGTGKAVTGAMPTMVLRQRGKSPATSTISVAEMTGLDGNSSETHYGNNVSMTEGSSYDLDVMLNGQSGTFMLRVPGMGQ